MTRAQPPFFVVGNPRSGTKMLRELLNNSPDIWISDIESHFIPAITRKIGTFGDLERRENFQRLFETLRGSRAFWYWSRRGVHVEADAWHAACRAYDWPAVLEGLFHCVHDQEIASAAHPWEQMLWGDKTPVYMTELPLLSELFPHARFVHIVRDPRDCSLSAATTWGDSPIRGAQRWADRTRLCRTAGRELGDARYLELRYEDLITDVTTTLGRVFDFLGLPVPADAGRFLRVPENYGAARGDAGIVADNKQKWKRAMDPALRRRIEELTADLLDDLSYEREHPNLPLRRLSELQMLAYRVRDAYRQVAFRTRELGLIEGIRFLRAR